MERVKRRGKRLIDSIRLWMMSWGVRVVYYKGVETSLYIRSVFCLRKSKDGGLDFKLKRHESEKKKGE